MLEREYLRFITPDMEMFKKDDQAQEADNGEPEVHQNEAIMEIVRDQTVGHESRLSMTDNFKEYKSPYLFDKQMRRDYMVFEMFSLVTASKNE